MPSKIQNYMNYTTYIYLFAILMILWFLYNRYEDKRMREENMGNYNAIQKYLLNDSSFSLILFFSNKEFWGSFKNILNIFLLLFVVE